LLVVEAGHVLPPVHEPCPLQSGASSL
jgi:hypothetical protein